MSRAALRLATYDEGDGSDLRVPLALALLDFYAGASDDEIVELVEALEPIEAAELEARAPRTRSG